MTSVTSGWLAGRWEATVDGDVVANGDIAALAIGPGETAIVPLPGVAAATNDLPADERGVAHDTLDGRADAAMGTRRDRDRHPAGAMVRAGCRRRPAAVWTAPPPRRSTTWAGSSIRG